MTPWDQGPDGAGQEAIYRGHRRRREARHPRLEPLDDLRQHRRAQPGRDRLLRAATPRRARLMPAVERLRDRADPGGAAHGRLARPVRDQLHVLPQPGHVRARRARRRSRAGCRSGGRSPRWSPGRRSPSPCSSWSRSPASTTGSRARSRCARPRLLGRAPRSRPRTGWLRRPTGSRRRR